MEVFLIFNSLDILYGDCVHYALKININTHLVVQCFIKGYHTLKNILICPYNRVYIFQLGCLPYF
ncbi:hypothetical protein AB205_0198750 [Aquarana catesbeiana]|uniref:Uncharacterized protein n=1 Tax=Aquarana catesbeiana TaxID=8400 RepID=A0A2G9RI68_AQUCT|nr:hypothetical protein AB205_0198750 [Aquarana catesbeiana]